MAQIVVVTGGSAGVGRATVDLFAQRGWDVAIVARGRERLERAAADVRARGRRACAVCADVADGEALDNAASQIERELGPIDVWINNAMATAFSPVAALTPAEFLRGTQVTYLGQVHGTMAALRRMRRRDQGTIVNIGSALSYRAIPLQSMYCAAKYAVRGFTDSLRSEIIHDGLKVHLTMVHLPAMNTPQFDWALNKMPTRPQPVPPIFQPEVAARAIYFAATHRRREVWVGLPTVKAILAGKIAPGRLDRYLAKTGYAGQLTDERKSPSAPENLFEPASGEWAAHGRFDTRSRGHSWEMWTSRHRSALVTLSLLAGAASLWSLLARRRHRSP
jgi:NAD(P)-dependent dehydrogenase (short-subunit alcohol dehydrogenase family)